MKKFAFAAAIAAVLTVLCSCSGMVSFIVFSRENDAEKFEKIYDVTAAEGGEKVVFYADEELTDLRVTLNEYDEQSDSFTETETLFTLDSLGKGEGIRIAVDFSREIPDVKVSYTRKNGQRREQFLYKNPQNEKLWLLEREN